MAVPAETLNPSVWGHVLQGFMWSIDQGLVPLTQQVKQLMSLTAGMGALISLGVWGWSDEHLSSRLSAMLRIVVGVLVAVLVLLNIGPLSNALINTMVRVGLFVGEPGAQKLGLPILTVAEFLGSPTNIVVHGFNITRPIQEYLDNLSVLGKLLSVGMKAIFEGSAAFTCFMFFVIAAHVMTVLIAVKISVVLLALFLPLALIPQTRDIPARTWNLFFGMTVRLGVLALVSSITIPMLTWLAFTPGHDPTYWSVLSQAAGAFILMILSFAIPHYTQMHGGMLLAGAMGALTGAARKAV